MSYETPDQGERESSWFKRFSSSGWFTPSLISLLCLGLLIAAYERGHGNFHKLSEAVIAPPAGPALPAGPGGQDPIRITRTATAIGTEPEFLSATLLPGRGLQVLQITASIPGHGEVPLLFAPSSAEAAQVLTGTGDDSGGDKGTSFGGAFLAPWAGRLTGAPSAVPGMLVSEWNGQQLTVPASPGANGQSVEGLLLTSTTDSIRTDVLPDGQSLVAVYKSDASAAASSSTGWPKGSWPSTLEITLKVELSGHTLDLSLHAKNTGKQPAPFGAGWRPYFALPSGDRAEALLTLPSNTILETNPRTGLPTGKTASVAGTSLDFLRASGVALGKTAIDATFVDLQSGVLADGPISQLRDPGYNFGLRMVPLTRNITHLDVLAPADKPWVSIAATSNATDPFGSEWASPQEAGMVMLAPGATFDWKVRLEISPLTSAVKALALQ